VASVAKGIRIGVAPNRRYAALTAVTYLGALGVGVLLYFATLVVLIWVFMLLPVVAAAALFGGIGAAFGRWSRGSWWLYGILLSAPTTVLVWQLLRDSLAEGLGFSTWRHVASLVVVPSATVIGAYLTSRAVRARAVDRSTGDLTPPN
jgi:hypothetical protein